MSGVHRMTRRTQLAQKSIDRGAASQRGTASSLRERCRVPDTSPSAGVQSVRCEPWTTGPETRACSRNTRRMRRQTMHFRREHLLTFLVLAVLPAAGAAQSITEFPLHALSAPRSIVAGPDGNLWYAEGRRASTGQPGIGRMTTSGAFVDFPIEESSVSFVNDLAAGPDGNLWFTQSDPDGGHAAVNRITPAGVVTRFPLPGGGLPLGITGGPDGNVWFTVFEAFQIGRITPNGVIRLFSLSGVTTPLPITAGPDGNLWFTGFHRIGRITPSGVIDLWVTAGHPRDITAGPDGNLWFTE